MKKGCLSEEIFEVVSDEESHYKRRSFDRKARRISSAFASFSLASRMTKILYFAEPFEKIDRGKNEKDFISYFDVNNSVYIAGKEEKG